MMHGQKNSIFTSLQPRSWRQQVPQQCWILTWQLVIT